MRKNRKTNIKQKKNFTIRNFQTLTFHDCSQIVGGNGNGDTQSPPPEDKKIDEKV